MRAERPTPRCRAWHRDGSVAFHVLAAAVLALGVAGCGDDAGDEGANGTTTTTIATTTTTAASSAPTTVSSTTTTTTAPVARAGDLAAVRLRLTKVADLDQPVALAVRPGTTSLYAAEKTGRVRVLDGNEAPLLDLRGDLSTAGEQGLLGLAFSPDGRYLYASYTNRDGDTRLEEWAMGAGARTIDTGSRRQVLAVDQPAANHNGGTILFGPDGYLWFGLGDGGGSGDRFGNAQNTDTLLGSILRIDPRPSGGAAYTSAPDNPFARGGGRPEIAVYGVRNPWKFSFDRATGDLWVGDVGQNTIEEIDWLPAGQILGANLGWPYFEGNRPFNGRQPPGPVVGAVHEYGRDNGQSVVGGYVYRGLAIPALAGVYLYTDTYRPVIQLLGRRDGGQVDVRSTGLSVPGGTVSSFAEDASGELYVLSLSGGVYRLDGA